MSGRRMEGLKGSWKEGQKDKDEPNGRKKKRALTTRAFQSKNKKKQRCKACIAV